MFSPWQHLHEIKLVAALAFGYFCYRRVKTVYNEQASSEDEASDVQCGDQKIEGQIVSLVDEEKQQNAQQGRDEAQNADSEGVKAQPDDAGGLPTEGIIEYQEKQEQKATNKKRRGIKKPKRHPTRPIRRNLIKKRQSSVGTVENSPENTPLQLMID